MQQDTWRGSDLDRMLDLIGFAAFVVEVTAAQTFVYRRINRQESEDIGMAREQVEGLTPHQLLPEEWADRVVANYRECLRMGRVHHYEDYLDTPEGRRWALTTLNPVRGEGRRIEFLLGVSCEVTELRRAQDALAQIRDMVAVTSSPRPASGLASGLSPREREVLAYLADGHSNGEIAYELHIAESTVKTHVRAVLRKLGASNRTEAAAKARRLGFLGVT